MELLKGSDLNFSSSSKIPSFYFCVFNFKGQSLDLNSLPSFLLKYLPALGIMASEFCCHLKVSMPENLTHSLFNKGSFFSGLLISVVFWAVEESDHWFLSSPSPLHILKPLCPLQSDFIHFFPDHSPLSPGPSFPEKCNCYLTDLYAHSISLSHWFQT